jgi:hypothetical protein
MSVEEIEQEQDEVSTISLSPETRLEFSNIFESAGNKNPEIYSSFEDFYDENLIDFSPCIKYSGTDENLSKTSPQSNLGY